MKDCIVITKTVQGGDFAFRTVVVNHTRNERNASLDN